MTDEKAKIVNALRESVKQLLVLTPQDVTQIDRLGTENAFVELADSFTAIQAALGRLEACGFDDVPERSLVHLNEQVKDVLRMHEQVKNYQPARGRQEKDQLAGQVRIKVADTFNAAAPILGVSAMRPLADYRGVLADIRKVWQEASAASEAAKEAARSATEAATKTGITEQSAHFQEEATEHGTMARRWFWLAMFGVASAIALAVWTFVHPYEITPATKWLMIQKFVAKFVLLSAASFVLVFAVRNYYTSRHNQVVNRHRAKALATFQAFASDAKDDETHKAVLTYAAKAAFSHQHSGYLKKEGDYAGPAIVDLTKLFMGK